MRGEERREKRGDGRIDEKAVWKWGSKEKGEMGDRMH